MNTRPFARTFWPSLFTGQLLAHAACVVPSLRFLFVSNNLPFSPLLSLVFFIYFYGWSEHSPWRSVYSFCRLRPRHYPAFHKNLIYCMVDLQERIGNALSVSTSFLLYRNIMVAFDSYVAPVAWIRKLWCFCNGLFSHCGDVYEVFEVLDAWVSSRFYLNICFVKYTAKEIDKIEKKKSRQ